MGCATRHLRANPVSPCMRTNARRAAEQGWCEVGWPQDAGLQLSISLPADLALQMAMRP